MNRVPAVVASVIILMALSGCMDFVPLLFPPATSLTEAEIDLEGYWMPVSVIVGPKDYGEARADQDCSAKFWEMQRSTDPDRGHSAARFSAKAVGY